MALDPAAPAHEAIVAILLLAMVSDGRVKPLEDEVLHAALNRSRSLSCLGEKGLRALEGRVASGLSDVTLAAAAANVPDELRLPLFAQALDMLLADGELSESEADFVNGLIIHLNINRHDAEPILDVLAVKNRL